MYMARELVRAANLDVGPTEAALAAVFRRRHDALKEFVTIRGLDQRLDRIPAMLVRLAHRPAEQDGLGHTPSDDAAFEVLGGYRRRCGHQPATRDGKSASEIFLTVAVDDLLNRTMSPQREA